MSTSPGINQYDEFDITPELRSIVDRVVDWESLEQGHFIAQVEKGRQGFNVGWANGFTKLNKYIHGKHRARYYLIGADSGVGKTTYADFSHILEQYEYVQKTGKPWYCYYYSFEISKSEKIARWVSYFIFKKYGKVMPSNFILGRISGTHPDDEDMRLIRIAYAYVEQMMKHIVFIEDPVHPTKIFSDLINYHYEKHGKIIRSAPTNEKKQGTVKGYIPNPGEEHAMVDVVIDHLALLHSEQGFDTKQTMDLMSKYAVALRNLFGTTFTMIQQFSTDMQGWHRNSKKINDKIIAPQRIDFGDSKYPYRDADVVLGLVNPYHFDLETYFGYEVPRFEGSLIGVYIMKNRYGPSSAAVSMFMNPLVGVFEEMPLSNEGFLLETFYDKATEIAKLCQKFSPKG
jgi:hypothetical protein